MSSRSNEIRYVPIDAAMRQRFSECAPAALARRTPARLRAQAASMLQWLVIGGVGLLGVYVWHWSAMSLLLVWLAGIAVGIAGDALKWLFARARLIRQMERFSDDQFVWAMVMAMQKNELRIREDALHRHRPGLGLTLDVVFGTIAAVLFAAWFRHEGIDAIVLVRDDVALQRALIAVALTPLIGLVAGLATLVKSADAEIDYQAGGRGVGLFFVMFAFMFFSDAGGDAVRALVVFINGAAIAVAVLAGLGLWIMARERDWLARHLSDTAVVAPRV
jgi:hypothetical protein